MRQNGEVNQNDWGQMALVCMSEMSSSEEQVQPEGCL